jgi:hypothetical protein
MYAHLMRPPSPAETPQRRMMPPRTPSSALGSLLLLSLASAQQQQQRRRQQQQQQQCDDRTFAARLAALNDECCKLATCHNGAAPTVCSRGCATLLQAVQTGDCRQQFSALLAMDGPGAAALSAAVVTLSASCLILDAGPPPPPPTPPTPTLPPRPDCEDSPTYHTVYGGMLVGCEMYSSQPSLCPDDAKAACPISCGTGCAIGWDDCVAAEQAHANTPLCLNGGICSDTDGVGAFECNCPVGFCGYQCTQQLSADRRMPDGSCPCEDDPSWRVGCVRKTPFFEAFVHKNDLFTNTCSGQTQGKLPKERRFSQAGLTVRSGRHQRRL